MKIGHFDIREFVPRAIWNAYGESSIWFIDPRILALMQFIRARYKCPVYVNNWHYGGNSENRGFRLPNSAIGAKYSQHKFGRAVDFNVRDVTPDEVRADIMKHQDDFINAGLTTIEDGEYAPTWVHVDNRYTRSDKVLIVKP